MPRRNRSRPQRRRIFVGCEGGSEVGYAAFIALLARESDLSVHLDIRRCHGGDPLTIVEKAATELRIRRYRHGTYAAQAIFLDADRRGCAPGRTADADRLIRRNEFHAIWSKPALEAPLLKHFPGQQNAEPAETALAFRQLRGCWPGYRKGMAAAELRAVLDRAAVERAAAVVPELRVFLGLVGLRS